MDYPGLSRFSHTIYCSEWVADLIPSGENWWARPGWIEHVIKLANLKSNETNVSRGPLDVRYDSPFSSMLGRYAVMGTGYAVMCTGCADAEAC
jgi:hypothetical protein